MAALNSSLGVTIDTVYRSGLAYFTVGETPYVRERDGKVHQASPRDYHPMLTQFDYESPLSETGKKFTSVEDVNHYILAITEFERIITLAEVANTPHCPTSLKEELEKLLDVQQEHVKDKYLETLQKIPGFDPVKLLLCMKIDGIIDYIQDKSKRGV